MYCFVSSEQLKGYSFIVVDGFSMYVRDPRPNQSFNPRLVNSVLEEIVRQAGIPNAGVLDQVIVVRSGVGRGRGPCPLVGVPTRGVVIKALIDLGYVRPEKKSKKKEWS